MANDIYFRTAIAGYNKQDVMRFIEKLNCEQTERTSELKDNNRLLQIEVQKLNDELSSLRKRCDDVEEKLKTAEASMRENEEKAVKFDDMQAKFADLMMNAVCEAQRKVSAAETEAKEITEKAKADVERRERELEDMKNELGATFVDNKKVIERSREEFSEVFEKLCSSIDSVYVKITNACKKADDSNE